MPQFCKITLGDISCVEPPRGFGHPTNLFRMTTGAGRYGRGQFLVSSTDYATLDDSPGVGGIITLSMSDGTNTVSFSVRLGGAAPAVTSIADADPDILEVFVFDLRTEEYTQVNKSFNVISTPYLYDDGDWSYWPSTINPGTPWTWVQLVSQLGLPELPISPEWTPRNLAFENMPLVDAMDRVAAELFLVVGWDWAQSALSFNVPGVMNHGNQNLFDQLTAQGENTYQVGGGEGFLRNHNRPPSSIVVAFPTINLDSDDPYDAGEYTQTIATGGAAPPQTLQVGNQPAFYQGGSTQNSGDLGDIAADIAPRCFSFMTVEEGAYTFSGMQKFQPDGAIREIVWHDSHEGPITTIFMNNGRDFKQLGDEWRTMELSANQLVDGIGSTQTSMSPAGTRYVWGNPSIPAIVKIVDNLTGAGKYDGTIYQIPTTDDGTGDLTLPDGMATGASCLIINTEEAYDTIATETATHRLFLGSYAVGAYGGPSKESPSRPVIILRGAFGRIDSPTVLAHGSYGYPNTDTWCKQSGATYNGTPVQFDPFWMGFDAGSVNFFMMTRTPLYDARGCLYSVSGEVQTTISTNACS